ncbi:MAG TPA: NADH-quinone oxidoreductase subunit N [Cyclobacteriaceae bacterium]
MNALYVICGLGLVSLIAELVNFKKQLIPVLIIGLIGAVTLSVLDWNTSLHYFNDMAIFDNVAIGFSVLICSVAVLWFWMAGDYFHEETHITDQAALVIFVVAGSIIMTSFNNMAMLFLGIEVLSLSLYVLAGSRKENLFSNEAAFKYFLMGSFATGFLLMGMALVYGATGQFHLDKIASAIATQPNLPGFFYAGVVMIVVGLSFKVSAVPFHFWAPDVYEGSPTVITALMATIVKTAAFAAFYRIVWYCFPGVQGSWLIALQVITVLTLVLANVSAVFQLKVKRMLAYSSVGHAGYILLALTTGGIDSALTIIYYLAAYSAATLCAFSVLNRIEQQGYYSEENFNGLYKRSPFLAVAMTIALLSMAGIPPLAGFFGKYLVFVSALKQGYVGVVIVAVVTSLIGVYYYLRVIVNMYFKSSPSANIEVSSSLRVLLIILIALIIGLGVFPDLLTSL